MSKQQDAFKVIRKELTEYDLQSVAEAAEVHVQTLYNWIHGTYCPQYLTFVKVAHVLGYNVTLTLEKR